MVFVSSLVISRCACWIQWDKPGEMCADARDKSVPRLRDWSVTFWKMMGKWVVRSPKLKIVRATTTEQIPRMPKIRAIENNKPPARLDRCQCF